MRTDKRYRLVSTVVDGNLHAAVKVLNERFPDGVPEIVAMDNTGFYTVVVWREEIKDKRPDGML